MLSYEQKMLLLSRCRPERKDELLLRIWRGETVDITKDEDMFYLVNKDRMSLAAYTDRDKYKIDAKGMKLSKEGLHDTAYGKSKGKKLRWLGDIPEEIFFTRPEFSPSLDKKERDVNIRKWLNSHPVFRAGDKKV